MRDERLEALSDKARLEQPIGLLDIFEVIEYQKAKREKSLRFRLLTWFKGLRFK